ncbi:hypothetical protein A9261_15095 [Vibrio tasmaniensis]|nr:hypothetical protein A9261_15095 [Vibrio tasmaniensis]
MKIGLVGRRLLVSSLMSISIYGCNSEGAFDSEKIKPEDIEQIESEDIEQSVESRDGEIVNITVTPYFIGIQKGKSQQLKAIASYDYYNELALIDITDSGHWEAEDLQIVTLTDTGEVSGLEQGRSSIMVSKEGLSETVEVNVCDDLAGVCLDTYNVGNNKLITNSPSVAFLDRLSQIEIEDAYVISEVEDMYDDIHTEVGEGDPFNLNNGVLIPDPNRVKGSFYLFSYKQASQLCQIYNAYQIGGRGNWRIPERYEIEHGMFNFGEGVSVFVDRGWPTEKVYWTSTQVYTDNNWTFNLFSGGLTNLSTEANDGYASCVSDF